jgi:hypothetical protein
LKKKKEDKAVYLRGASDYPLMEKRIYNGSAENTLLYVYGPTGLIAVNDGMH